MDAKPTRLLQARRRLAVLNRTIESELAEDGAYLALTVPDKVDVAQQLAQVHVAQEISHLMDRNRLEVEHALERARLGAYGICEDCEQPIEPERLRFRPEATRCVNCQSRRDR